MNNMISFNLPGEYVFVENEYLKNVLCIDWDNQDQRIIIAKVDVKEVIEKNKPVKIEDKEILVLNNVIGLENKRIEISLSVNKEMGKLVLKNLPDDIILDDRQ